MEGHQMNPNSDSKPTSNQPAVYGVHRSRSQWRFSRRGFVSAAGLASAAMLAHLGRHPEAQALAVEALPEPSDNALIALEPGERFQKTWQLRNSGTQPWGDDAELRLTDPAGLRAPASYRLPDLQPGESVALRVEMVAPEAPGVSQSQWRVSANGVLSQTLFLPVVVRTYEGPPTPTPTISPTPSLTPWAPGGCILESPHPYTTDDDGEWLITNPDPNAGYSMLHFQRLELAHFDYIYLYKDQAWSSFQNLSDDDNGDDIWTESCEGRIIRVKFFPALCDGYWGFCIDNVGTAAAPTPTPTRTPCASHCSCTCTSYRPCSCNPRHCYCDTVCTCFYVYHEQ